MTQQGHNALSAALSDAVATFAAANPRQAIARGVAYVSGDRGRDGIVQGRPILENVTPVHFLRNRLRCKRDRDGQ